MAKERTLSQLEEKGREDSGTLSWELSLPPLQLDHRHSETLEPDSLGAELDSTPTDVTLDKSLHFSESRFPCLRSEDNNTHGEEL